MLILPTSSVGRSQATLLGQMVALPSSMGPPQSKALSKSNLVRDLYCEAAEPLNCGDSNRENKKTDQNTR